MARQNDGGETQADDTGVGAAVHGLISTGLRRGLGGMSLTSLSTLATLERTGPRRVTDLAVVEGVTQPAMTAVVRSLERSGFVQRREDPADGRVALIAITREGNDLLRIRRRSGAEAFEQLVNKLPAEEKALLIAALPALQHLRSIDDEEREPPNRPSDVPLPRPTRPHQ
jgi:DNA-binding MarR family transcriptional regulator